MTTRTITILPPQPLPQQVLVYGFRDCEYITVMEKLQLSGTEVYTCAIGDPQSRAYESLTQGFDISLQSEILPCPSQAKRALVHLMLDNYRRERTGDVITQLFFCLEIENPPTKTYPPLRVDNIFSKHPKHNVLFTVKELRRLAKLSFDPRVDERIRTITQTTTTFFKVICGKNGAITLQRIPPPIQQSEFLHFQGLRKSSERDRFYKQTIATRPHGFEDWRTQLPQILDRIDTLLTSVPYPLSTTIQSGTAARQTSCCSKTSDDAASSIACGCGGKDDEDTSSVASDYGGQDDEDAAPVTSGCGGRDDEDTASVTSGCGGRDDEDAASVTSGCRRSLQI